MGFWRKVRTNYHTYYIYALSNKVLAVASCNYPRMEGESVSEFAVYIDAVPGKNFDEEFMIVAEHGQKLPKNVAKALFPKLFEKYRTVRIVLQWPC